MTGCVNCGIEICHILFALNEKNIKRLTPALPIPPRVVKRIPLLGTLSRDQSIIYISV
jgi:hypothetical protein